VRINRLAKMYLKMQMLFWIFLLIGGISAKYESFPLTEEDFARAETIVDEELIAKYSKIGGPLNSVRNSSVPFDDPKSVTKLKSKTCFSAHALGRALHS
jgi:hypothetical protein